MTRDVAPVAAEARDRGEQQHCRADDDGDAQRGERAARSRRSLEPVAGEDPDGDQEHRVRVDPPVLEQEHRYPEHDPGQQPELQPVPTPLRADDDRRRAASVNGSAQRMPVRKPPSASRENGRPAIPVVWDVTVKYVQRAVPSCPWAAR